MAIPDAFVTAVLTPPANVPPAPLEGAVKATVTPLTPAPLPFTTAAISGAEKFSSTAAVCPEPLAALMVSVAPVEPAVISNTVPQPLTEHTVEVPPSPVMPKTLSDASNTRPVGTHHPGCP